MNVRPAEDATKDPKRTCRVAITQASQSRCTDQPAEIHQPEQVTRATSVAPAAEATAPQAVEDEEGRRKQLAASCGA